MVQNATTEVGLCTTCRALPLREMITKSLKGKRSDPWPCFKHRPSYAALQLSAVNCSLCALIGDAIKSIEGPREEHPIMLYAKFTNRMDTRGLMQLQKNPAEDTWFFPREWMPGKGERGEALIQVVYRKGRDSDATFIRVAVEEGDPLAKAISGRVVTGPPMDLPALNQIRTWIKECDPTHDTCSSKTKDSTNLPMRVLAVGQPGCQTVRLVQTGGKRGAYLALSHCWGKARNLTTTTATLELRKKGIHLADLPATIQDAVLVTRELGFAYIWIDTICILQDSLEDWKVEAAKMADVYSNAYLTITASSSDGDEKGFLWPRQKQSRVCLPNIDSRKPPFFLQHLTKQHMTKPLRDDMSDEPLTNRGWCIQERYLSRRSLFFCHDQLRWECRRLTASECGTSSSQIDFRINNLYGTALSDNAYKDATGKDSMGGDLRYKGWYDLVAKYMGCNLTYQSDKLPAIGCLAKALAAISKDEYYAGLWGESIVTGLLWSRSTLRLLEGQDPYRAPSWSWASVAGEIEFPLLSLSDRYRIRHYNDLWESVVPTVQLNGEDAYGAVRGGQITITAPLHNVQKFIPGQSSRPKNGRQAVFAIDGSLLAIPCVIDTVEEPGLDTHVTILFLAYRNLTSNPGTNKIRSERAYLSRPWNDYFGLVLRAVEKGADEVREVWTRIGMVNGYASLGGKEEGDDQNRYKFEVSAVTVI